MCISPKFFGGQLNAWINRKLVSREVRKLLFSVVKKWWRPGWRCVSSTKGIYFNKENSFILRDCSDWKLDSTISLKLTDLLLGCYINLFGGIEVRRKRSWTWNINFGTGTSAERNKQQPKANRGVGIIVAQNNQSSQTSIPVKRRRRVIRTITLKRKQITAEIKTGKEQRCYYKD